MSFISKYKSKIGWIEIKGDDRCIHSLVFTDEEPHLLTEDLPEIYRKLNHQLDLYFLKNKWDFDIPLAPNGTSFQRKVWEELRKIPFGKTISYLDLAHRLGDEKVIRAAASANGKNPISILIPCHRVIGFDGSLTGYAGGLYRKKFLIEHEKGFFSPTLF